MMKRVLAGSKLTHVSPVWCAVAICDSETSRICGISLQAIA